MQIKSIIFWNLYDCFKLVNKLFSYVIVSLYFIHNIKQAQNISKKLFKITKKNNNTEIKSCTSEQFSTQEFSSHDYPITS